MIIKQMFCVILVCMMAMSVMSSHAHAAVDAPSISKLKSSETLEVQLTSTGCFHFSMSYYQFQVGQVTIYEMQEEAPKEGEKPSSTIKYTKQKLGLLKLTKKDMERLDNLFNYYATDASTGCTSVDNLAITLKSGAKTLKSYAYEDASCNTYGKEHLMTLPALNERLQDLQKKQQQLKKPDQEAGDKKEE